jgi:glycosyltransferase involved in cell wall biosynthesis
MKKFNIGIFHYIANFTDGVSLEANKWRSIFEEMGHTTYLCAGRFGSSPEVVVEEMYHHSPEARLLNFNTFKALRDYRDEKIYRSELYRFADVIQHKISSFIEEKNINLLVPQNLWSVGANPSVAIALTNIMHRYSLPAIAHNHDFYFERMDGYVLTSPTAVEFTDCYLPPRSDLVRHVVINSLAQKALYNRKGISSIVVPNIFDFESLPRENPWGIDDFNQDFRKRIGLSKNDILILQATRIVTRKGIELAIDFVKALNSPKRRAIMGKTGLFDGRKFDDNSRIVLVLAGYTLDDITGRYKNLLAEKAENVGIEARFIEGSISERRSFLNGEKIYSLWDSYVHADFVTYPSQWEGWGNQFLEAIRAKLPILVFEYPVYQADIKNKRFNVVSLGSQIVGRDQFGLVKVSPEVIEAAADQAVILLTDPKIRHEAVEVNYRLGKKHYSTDALYIYLDQLLKSFNHDHNPLNPF